MKVYSDPKGRPGKWRVRLPDGRFKSVDAETYPQAVEAGKALLSVLEPEEAPWVQLVERHIHRRESGSPELLEKKKWINTRYCLRAFAREFSGVVSPDKVKMAHFLDHWDGLTRHQQDNLRPELNRFIKWAMLSGSITLPSNPIDLLDKKALPKKKRRRLDVSLLRRVIQVAESREYFGLAHACRLSLMTTLRRSDVVGLRWDSIVDGALCVTVSKSVASRGEVQATRLRWVLAEHPALLEELKECRRQALMNRDCPFVVSHFGAKVQGKEHPCQMTPDMVSKQFAECVRIVDPEPGHPTFHEIRSLSAALLEKQGTPGETISKIMAHTDRSTTELYLHGHERNFFEVDYSVTA